MYLILGSEKVSADRYGRQFGSGRANSPTPKRLTPYSKNRDPKTFRLRSAHSHSHGDHAANDFQFVDRRNTDVVGLGAGAVQEFFDLDEWPRGSAIFELGQRPLTVTPTPGHETSDISIHDPKTKTVFTGDILYPGMLIIRDWPVYVASIERLDHLNQQDPFDSVLGAHIEMTNVPAVHYPYGTRYQPDEHGSAANGSGICPTCWDALKEIGDEPAQKALDHFIIYPI